MISAQCIHQDSQKTEKVRMYPQPVNVAGVRRFLGLASYHRRFVPNFASVVSPLHVLTRKNVPFQWIPECERTFEELKQLLITTPVLAYPMFGSGQSFILETDASNIGLEAVLSQVQELRWN